MRVRGVPPKVRVVLLAVAMTILGSGCNLTADVLTGPFDARFTSNLQTASLDTFDDCSDLISHIKAEALGRVGPWGLEGGVSARPIPAGDELPAGVAPPTSTDRPTATGAAVGASGTAVSASAGDGQPDLAKADTERMVMVRDNSLVQLDLRARKPTVTGTLRLPDGTMADQLVLHGDTALVISTDWVPTTLASGPASGISLPYLPSTPRTVIHQVDVARPSAMSVKAALTLDATVLAAESDGDTLQLVLEHRPDDLGFVLPSGADTTLAASINRQVVTDSSLAAWFGEYELERDGRTSSGRIVPCDATHQAPLFSGFATVTMLSLPIDGNLAPSNAVSLLGDPVAVSTSNDGAIVATNKWLPIDSSEATIFATEHSYRTDLHSFTVDSSGAADYAASGSIEGHPLDLGSLAEHDGVIGIAVRHGAPWGEAETTSVITAQRRGRQIQELGRVDNPNGSSATNGVRFIGDRAYAGSTQHGEALRTIDLSEPARPRLAADLALPGFLSHLQPIGDNRIIGVGQDLDPATGRSNGLRISLFDVTNAQTPRLLATTMYQSGSSAVQWDPRASTWSPEQRLLVLPIETRSVTSVSGVTEAVAVRVTDTAITEVGRVSHNGGTIDRSIVHGDRILTLSYVGVQASRVADLDPIAWTPVTF